MDRHLFALLLGMSLAPACLQQVDDGLATSSREVDPPPCGPGQPYACMFPVNTRTPAIDLKANAAGDVTDSADAGDGCAKINLDATNVLQRKCAGCHEGAGTAINSPLTFILEPERLISTPSSMQFNGRPYVVPGNPAGSLIYQRAVISKDMPYSPSTLVLPNFLTVSESSLLYQWIASCVAPKSTPTTSDMAAGGTAAGGTAAGGTGTTAAGGSAHEVNDELSPASGGTLGGAGGTGGVGGVGGAAPAGAGGSTPTGMGGSAPAGTGGTAPVGTGGTTPAGTGGTTPVGTGGATTAGTGGAIGSARPCDGLCQAPTVFSVPPAFQSPGLGQNAACYQTVSTLAGFTCGNGFRRTFSINGMTLNCGALPAINTIPRRNGGYCVQVSGGGNQAAFFSAN